MRNRGKKKGGEKVRCTFHELKKVQYGSEKDVSCTTEWGGVSKTMSEIGGRGLKHQR